MDWGYQGYNLFIRHYLNLLIMVHDVLVECLFSLIVHCMISSEMA